MDINSLVRDGYRQAEMIDYVESAFNNLESKAIEQAATADDLGSDFNGVVQEDLHTV